MYIARCMRPEYGIYSVLAVPAAWASISSSHAPNNLAQRKRSVAQVHPSAYWASQLDHARRIWLFVLPVQFRLALIQQLRVHAEAIRYLLDALSQ